MNWNLSDQLFDIKGYFEPLLEMQDVQEFMNRLSQEVWKIMKKDMDKREEILMFIDKLAGKKLR